MLTLLEQVIEQIKNKMYGDTDIERKLALHASGGGSEAQMGLNVSRVRANATDKSGRSLSKAAYV